MNPIPTAVKRKLLHDAVEEMDRPLKLLRQRQFSSVDFKMIFPCRVQVCRQREGRGVNRRIGMKCGSILNTVPLFRGGNGNVKSGPFPLDFKTPFPAVRETGVNAE